LFFVSASGLGCLLVVDAVQAAESAYGLGLPVALMDKAKQQPELNLSQALTLK
jgi:hypothetical protein